MNQSRAVPPGRPSPIQQRKTLHRSAQKNLFALAISGQKCEEIMDGSTPKRTPLTSPVIKEEEKEDIALNDTILPSVLRREVLVAQMRDFLDSSPEVKREVVYTFMRALRLAALDVVETYGKWQKEHKWNQFNQQSFVFHGKNYLFKMITDLDFLESHHRMLSSSFLQIPLVKNPFFTHCPWKVCYVLDEETTSRHLIGLDEALLKRIRDCEIIIEGDLTLVEKRAVFNNIGRSAKKALPSASLSQQRVKMPSSIRIEAINTLTSRNSNSDQAACKEKEKNTEMSSPLLTRKLVDVQVPNFRPNTGHTYSGLKIYSKKDFSSPHGGGHERLDQSALSKAKVSDELPSRVKSEELNLSKTVSDVATETVMVDRALSDSLHDARNDKTEESKHSAASFSITTPLKNRMKLKQSKKQSYDREKNETSVCGWEDEFELQEDNAPDSIDSLLHSPVLCPSNGSEKQSVAGKGKVQSALPPIKNV